MRSDQPDQPKPTLVYFQASNDALKQFTCMMLEASGHEPPEHKWISLLPPPGAVLNIEKWRGQWLRLRVYHVLKGSLHHERHPSAQYVFQFGCQPWHKHTLWYKRFPTAIDAIEALEALGDARIVGVEDYWSFMDDFFARSAYPNERSNIRREDPDVRYSSCSWRRNAVAE